MQAISAISLDGVDRSNLVSIGGGGILSCSYKRVVADHRLLLFGQ